MQDESSLILLLHSMKSLDIINAVSVYLCSLFAPSNAVSNIQAKIQLLQPLLRIVISILGIKDSHQETLEFTEAEEKTVANNSEVVEIHDLFENSESTHFSWRSRLDESELQSHMVTMELLLLTVNNAICSPVAIGGSQEVVYTLTQLVSFASSFCSYLNNKISRSLTTVYKKAFLSYCQHILPQWLRLQSLPPSCHLDAILLESQLLFSCCVFNDRSMLEYSSIRPIFESSQVDADSKNDNKKRKSLKRKFEKAPTQNEDEKFLLNKSFYELFFETLGSCYFSASENGATVPLCENVVSIITNTFAAQSTAMELRAVGHTTTYSKDKHVVVAATSGHVESSGSSAVDWRKNVVRQLHYILHVIDTLWQSMLTAGDKEIPQQSSKHIMKKSKKSKEASKVDIGDGTTIASETVRMPEVHVTQYEDQHFIDVKNLKSLIRFGQLRNSALTTLQKTLSNQSIPNHASLEKYIQRLKAIASRNISCLNTIYEKIEQVVAEDALISSEHMMTSTSNTERVLELYTLLHVELESILIFAAIDHSLILENGGGGREGNLKMLIALSLSGRFYVPCTDSAAHKQSSASSSWISWVEDARASKYSSISDVVAAYTVQPYNQDGEAESHSTADASMTAYVRDNLLRGKSRCAQEEFHIILMKVWGKKLSLLRLIMSIQTQLRAVDEVVAAFLQYEMSCVATSSGSSATHADIFSSKFITVELASAFSEVLVGQFDNMWSLLNKTFPSTTAMLASESEPTLLNSPVPLSFGIIRCTILQNLIRCTENQQKSEIGFLGSEDGNDTTELFSSLIHGHLQSMHSALRTCRARSDSSIGRLIFSLLDSLSCLISYITFRYSTSMKSLFVEYSDSLVYNYFLPSGSEHATSCTSLKYLLLDASQQVLHGALPILEDLVTVDDQDFICYQAFLKTVLAGLFCSINVSALGNSNTAEDIQSHWHFIELGKKSLHSLIESPSAGKEETMIQILYLLLQNVIIWKDFACVLAEGEYPTELTEADLLPFFQAYFRCTSSHSTQQQQQQEQERERVRSLVFTALMSVDVIDCSFLIHCLQRAICDQWRAASQTNGTQTLSTLATNILHRVPVSIFQYLPPLMPLLSNYVASAVKILYNGSGCDIIHEGLESASTVLILFLQKDKTACITREIDFISTIGISAEALNSNINSYFLFVEEALAISPQTTLNVSGKQSKLRHLVLVTLWARVRHYSNNQHDHHLQVLLSDVNRIISQLLIPASTKIALLHTISDSIVDRKDPIAMQSARIIEESYLVIMDKLLSQMKRVVVEEEESADSSSSGSSSSSSSQVDSKVDAYFMMLAECIAVMQKISPSEAETSVVRQSSDAYRKLIFEVLSTLVKWTSIQSKPSRMETSACGWLLLVQKLPIELLLICGVLKFDEDSTGVVYVREAALQVFLQTLKEKVIVSVVSQLLTSCSIGCIVNVFLSLVRLTLSASQCNIDLVDVYKMINRFVLCEIFPLAVVSHPDPDPGHGPAERSSVESFRTVVWSVYIDIVSGIAKDPLRSAKINRESLSSFLREIIAANLRFCEMQISSSKGGKEESDVVVSVQECYAVTVYLHTTTEHMSSLCKVGRSIAAPNATAEVDKRDDDESLFNLQFYFWVGGLFGLVSLITSRLPCVAVAVAVDSSIPSCSSRVVNVFSAKTIHSLLLILERIVQHASHGSHLSSSPATPVLSTALGSVCVALGRLLDCLIVLDFVGSAEKSTVPGRAPAHASPEGDVLTHVHQCYQVSRTHPLSDNSGSMIASNDFLFLFLCRYLVGC